jgi:hypothetical protein
MKPKIHRFEDSEEAYNESQSSESVKDGDILATPDMVGVLVKAWPVAVVGPRGEFHTLKAGLSWDEFEGGKYAKSAEKAREYAKENGLSGLTTTPFQLLGWAAALAGAAYVIKNAKPKPATMTAQQRQLIELEKG